MVERVGKIVWTGRVLSILVCGVFLFSAYVKLNGGAELVEGMAKLGLPHAMSQPLAWIELSCVALYLVAPTSVLGAILLTGYLGGAICTHWRVSDPFIGQFVVGVVLWLGLWLREPRLRGLIPLRLPRY